MDLQAFVDTFDCMTCIMSVEMKEDGNYGDIRIVTGNKAYIRSIEVPPPNVPQLMMPKFVPNSIYQNYFPKDLNFETMIYTSAVLKKPVHTYVHPERFDFWFDLYTLPLMNEGNMYYCTYSQEVTQNAETEKMSNISMDTATAVINTCIKLRSISTPDQFLSVSREIITDIRDLCGSESCVILLVDEADRSCQILGEAYTGKMKNKTMKELMDDNFYDLAETWPETIGGSNCLIAKNETEMDYIKERNPGWYASLTGSGVESIILFPLKNGLELLGYIWVTNFNTEKASTIKETLELTTYFIGSEIANHKLLEKLRITSSIDKLTGILNRNEMNNRIERLKSGKEKLYNFGIVFADLNGLKRINDRDGHIAGDRLIKDATTILQKVFDGYDLYRAGGDEFMIIVTDTSIADLNDFCAKVKSNSDAFPNVHFAIGYYFASESSEILSALKTADARMYEDKALYYAANPELKRT